MSFFSDLFKGDFSNLGTDLTHAPESLAKHPSELYETLGGAAALATGGLALGGGLGALGLGGAAEAGAGGILTGGDALGIGASDYAAAGGAADLSAGADTALGTGATGSTLGTSFPTGNLFGLQPGITGEGASTLGGDVTGSLGGDVQPIIGDGAGAAVSSSPGTGGAGGGGFSGIIDSIMNPTLGGVSKAAGVGVAGGLLGYDLLKGNPTDPNQKVLSAQAGQLSAQGNQLQSYLQNGTLPPALQAQLKQATDAEKARIISGYASRGQPTDPNQNSALAQELNSVDTNAIAAMAQTQIQLLNTGINETGMSTQLYETLVKLDQGQNDQTMKAIQGFAAALGGGGLGGGGQTFKLQAASP